MTVEITTPLLIGLIVGMTEVCKRLLPGNLKSRLTPLIALLIGLGLSAGAYGMNFNGLIMGLMMGLGSIGLFSGTKSVIRG